MGEHVFSVYHNSKTEPKTYFHQYVMPNLRFLKEPNVLTQLANTYFSSGV